MAGDEPKACARCGRLIEWRKKWRRDWDNVRFCSSACQRAGVRDLDRQLEQATLRLLRERGPGKTICPSEAARAVADAGEHDGARGVEHWRELMEPARMAARRLVAAGLAEITQNGRPVDPSSAKGPIRVRRTP